MAADEIALNQLLNSMLHEIGELEAKLEQKKQLVNGLCLDRGQPARFTDIGGGRTRPIGMSSRRDQFYGKPLATAMREYLEMRGRSDRGGLGAANINEIHAALVEGGFKFETKNIENAKRGLRDALSKNVIVFHRVGDAYGLTEWYPKPPRPDHPAKKARRAASKKSKARQAASETKKLPPPANVVDLKPVKKGETGHAA